MKVYEKLKGKQSIEYGHALFNLGIVFDAMDENEKAIENYEKSLGIKKNILGSSHLECAHTLNSLGSCLK